MKLSQFIEENTYISEGEEEFEEELRDLAENKGEDYSTLSRLSPSY